MRHSHGPNVVLEGCRETFHSRIVLVAATEMSIRDPRAKPALGSESDSSAMPRTCSKLASVLLCLGAFSSGCAAGEELMDDAPSASAAGGSALAPPATPGPSSTGGGPAEPSTPDPGVADPNMPPAATPTGGAAPTTSDPPAQDPPAIGDLPFAVDDVFAPSGFMGDGETPDHVLIVPDGSVGSDDTCGGDRPVPDAVGRCYQITYAAAGDALWAGVFWQSPPNNWGAQPGHAIPTGATRISFFAKGSAGGEVVKFVAGIQGMLAYSDAFKIEEEFTLSAEWTGYSLMIPAADYGRVIGAFGWVASADPEMGVVLPVSFQVDDIRWE